MRNLFISFLILFSIPQYLFSADVDEKLHKKCIYPTVRVRYSKNTGGGTGFIVKSELVDGKYHNTVITCAHCFDEDCLCDYVVEVTQYHDWSEFVGFKAYPSKIYAFDCTRDMAVIVFESEEEMPTVDLSLDEKLYIGNDVFRVGCGAGDEPRLDYGKITSLKGAIKGISDGYYSYRTSILTIYGDSGGPVFHNYKVVGYVQAIRIIQLRMGYMPVFNISFVVPFNRIVKWDEELHGAVGFAYKADKKTPSLPFYKMKIDNLELNILAKTEK